MVSLINIDLNSLVDSRNNVSLLPNSEDIRKGGISYIDNSFLTIMMSKHSQPYQYKILRLPFPLANTAASLQYNSKEAQLNNVGDIIGCYWVQSVLRIKRVHG